MKSNPAMFSLPGLQTHTAGISRRCSHLHISLPVKDMKAVFFVVCIAN